jgi:hypothetical protein
MTDRLPVCSCVIKTSPTVTFCVTSRARENAKIAHSGHYQELGVAAPKIR